jgi:hypothetical protein
VEFGAFVSRIKRKTLLIFFLRDIVSVIHLCQLYA